MYEGLKWESSVAVLTLEPKQTIVFPLYVGVLVKSTIDEGGMMMNVHVSELGREPGPKNKEHEARSQRSMINGEGMRIQNIHRFAW